MPSFLEKAVNCYISYLTNLNYGITDQKYCILYDSWILLKNNITDRRLVDYYSSHLNCPIKIKLELSMDVKNLITWAINKSGATTNLFEWNNIDILNDIGTNFNDKLFVLMHKTFNLPFKISFILKIIPR